MSGLDGILSGVELAASIAMPELGAMSLLEQAAGSAISQMAGQMFSGALSQLSHSGNLSPFMNAFSAGFNAGANFLGAGSAPSALSEKIMGEAFGMGAATAMNVAKDAIAQILKNAQQSNQSSPFQSASGGDDAASQINNTGSLSQQTEASGPSSGKSGGKSGNWLEALAQAMGEALGNMASKLVADSNQLQSLSGNASNSQSSAQQFQVAESEFQADSQLFGILSNAFATAIKSIGDGMSTLAQKG
jgi:hypothetical protein